METIETILRQLRLAVKDVLHGVGKREISLESGDDDA